MEPIALRETNDWRSQLADVITCASELLEELGLQAGAVGLSDDACRAFPLRVPRAFVARMTLGDAADPLLRQVLASREEMLPQPGFVDDPVKETGAANPRPGIIHKYRGRVLLIVAGGCAIHCRYCFRRHFPYGDNTVGRAQWQEALQLVREDPSISEVILSGGDPLVATDKQLAELIASIAAIAHVERLRVHTRLPVVIPDRVTGALLDALTATRLQTVVVLHSNHAKELDASVATGVGAMRDRGITVLNQAVLLAGVNATAQAQISLAQTLFTIGILPYYLHLLDPVRGAAHFDVSETLARALHADMRAALPGYLVPSLVREVAGRDAKVVLA